MKIMKEMIIILKNRVKFKNTNSSLKRKAQAYKVLSIMFVVMILFSLYNLYNIRRDRTASQSAINEAQSIFSMAESNIVPENKSDNETANNRRVEQSGNETEKESSAESIEYTEDLIREPIQEILNLKERNEDVIGWINISNTNIDYPVVQADDNVFYHRRDWLKNNSIPGSIFLDYRNDGIGFANSGAHSIIYGHHIKDGSMFQNLMKFKDLNFYQENRFIEITDLYETHKFEIFSAYVTKTDFYFIETRFPTKTFFTNLANEFIERSMHPTEIEISGDDHILTLVTCTYEYDDARFVVHARRID